jgi:hypothetical protein
MRCTKCGHLGATIWPEHKRLHGGAVRIEGEQLECPALVVADGQTTGVTVTYMKIMAAGRKAIEE